MQTVQQPLPPLQVLHKMLAPGSGSTLPPLLPWTPAPVGLGQPAVYPNCHDTRGLHVHTRGLHARTPQSTHAQAHSCHSYRTAAAAAQGPCTAREPDNFVLQNTLAFKAVTLHALVRLPPPELQSGRPPPAKRCSSQCTCKAAVDLACRHRRGGSLNE